MHTIWKNIYNYIQVFGIKPPKHLEKIIPVQNQISALYLPQRGQQSLCRINSVQSDETHTSQPVQQNTGLYKEVFIKMNFNKKHAKARQGPFA